MLLTALGFFMWPHTFGSALSAKDENVFRRNAAILPLYQLLIAFVFFVGFAAVLKVPGLAEGETDLALLTISKQAFPQWFVGFIGVGGHAVRARARLDAADRLGDDRGQEHRPRR